jgi:hypothetical protein
MKSSLNSSKKRTKLTILSKEGAQDSEFRSFFGRLQDTINCFRDLLTLKVYKLQDFFSASIYFNSQIREFLSKFSPKEANNSKQEIICWNLSLQKVSPWPGNGRHGKY